MSSKKSCNCFLLFKIIQMKDYSSSTACDYCSSVSSLCIVMKDHPKCAECTHHGCSCVPVSLELLNQAHNHLIAELEAAEAEHFQIFKKQFWIAEKQFCVLTQITHLHKTLKQNKTCTISKVQCIVTELDEDINDVSENENNSNSLNPFSSILWKNLTSTSPSQTAAAFLCSSWGLFLVSKLILRYHILFTWQDSELSH